MAGFICAGCLHAGYYDADDDPGTLTFTVTDSSGAIVASGTTGTLLADEQGSWPVPSGAVVPGNTYSFSVTASDGTLTSPTASLPFTVSSSAATATAALPDLLPVPDPAGVAPEYVESDASSAGLDPSASITDIPGFVGPYYDPSSAAGQLVVLQATVAQATSGTWSATGLVRNETRVDDRNRECYSHIEIKQRRDPRS